MFDGNLKILIVDDEAPARSRLSAMVGDIGGWTVAGEAANGNEALQACEQYQPDVVLLDIRMPGMDGLEVASHLCCLQPPPAVVFTTAYDEYAVEAFETHAVGYLLKPVRRERLLRALEHAVKVGRMQLQQLAEMNPDIGPRQRISVQQAGSLKLVPLETVLSFHADQKYVRMVVAEADGTQDYLLDETLKDLEHEFADEFIRVHRNSLVRVSAIDRVETDANGQCQVWPQHLSEPLAVSRRHAAALKQRLRN